METVLRPFKLFLCYLIHNACAEISINISKAVGTNTREKGQLFCRYIISL